MMLCSRCKKRPAVVFITAMQGEKKKNDGLCLVCAKELHVPQIDEYMKQMGITDEELEQISNQMMDMMDGESFEMGGSGVMPQFLQSFMKDPGKIFGNLKDDSEESNELQTADGDEDSVSRLHRDSKRFQTGTPFQAEKGTAVLGQLLHEPDPPCRRGQAGRNHWTG